ARPGDAGHHPLPAPFGLHQTRPGARAGRRPHRRLGRAGAGAGAGSARLRPVCERRMSLARAIETGDVTELPSRRDEDWRWTDLRGLVRTLPPASPPGDAAALGAGP